MQSISASFAVGQNCPVSIELIVFLDTPTISASFACDIQVNEDRRYDSETIRADYSLSVTRVDAEDLDGMTYDEWLSEEGVQ